MKLFIVSKIQKLNLKYTMRNTKGYIQSIEIHKGFQCLAQYAITMMN